MIKKQPAFLAKTWLASTLTFLLATSSALAQRPGGGGYHMGPWMPGYWGMGWFGFIVTILFFLIVLTGAGALIRWFIQPPGDKQRMNLNNGSKALSILRERYARGEISHEEFESMKKDLSD